MPRQLLAALLVLTATVAISAPKLTRAQQPGAPQKTKMSGREEKIISAVRAVIEAQAAAWNRGDIEGYMDGYARSDETIFVSGDTLTRGWQTVMERYKKGYDSREKMGQLTFSELEIEPLSNEAAVATGRWLLTRAKDTPHGRFTLIFRRTKAGWRIVHDHTSSA